MDRRQAITAIVDAVFCLTAGILTLVLDPAKLPAILNILGLAQALVLALVLYFAIDIAIARVETALKSVLQELNSNRHSALR